MSSRRGGARRGGGTAAAKAEIAAAKEAAAKAAREAGDAIMAGRAALFELDVNGGKTYHVITRAKNGDFNQYQVGFRQPGSKHAWDEAQMRHNVGNLLKPQGFAALGNETHTRYVGDLPRYKATAAREQRIATLNKALMAANSERYQAETDARVNRYQAAEYGRSRLLVAGNPAAASHLRGLEQDALRRADAADARAEAAKEHYRDAAAAVHAAQRDVLGLDKTPSGAAAKTAATAKARASSTRTPAQRAASAQKAAETRKRNAAAKKSA